MAWAIKDPSGFGEFFLDGNFVGWKDQLRDHLDTGLTDTEKREQDVTNVVDYAYYVSRKFTQPIGPGGPYIARLETLKDYECPRTFAIERMRKPAIGALIELYSRMLAVDQTLMELIDALEPGMHQFWPITIILPNGTPVTTPYFGLRIAHHLHSFVPAASVDGAWENRQGHYYPTSSTKPHVSGLAMSAGVIGSAHLWREIRLSRPALFISDALSDRIRQAGLRVPPMIKLLDAA